MKKRLFKILSISLASVFVLVACAQPAPVEVSDAIADVPGLEGNGEVQEELRVVVNSLPISLDPHFNNDTPSIRFRRTVFESLIFQNYMDLSLEPGLAVAWDMSDPQAVELELRQGVTFHNGDPFNAEAVRFSLLRAADSPGILGMSNMIEDVEIVDDYNVIVHLNIPFVPMLNQLALSQLAIVSPRAVEEAEAAGREFGDEPVGTGPFVFEEFIPGSHLHLLRNDDWWGNAPAFESMMVRAIAEQGNRLIEIETGNADIAIDVAPMDIPHAEASPNVVVHQGPSTSITYLGFNMMEGPLADIRVRHAIKHALNMDAIVDIAFSGAARTADSLISTMTWGHAGQEPFEVDLNIASELLADAGFPGGEGLDLRVWYNAGNQQRADMAEMIQNQLLAIGINVVVETLEWSSYLERTANGEHDMFILGWAPSTQDPDVSLFALLHSSNVGNPGNRSFFIHERADYLLEAGRSELDYDARLEIYAELMQIVRDEAPVMFAVEQDTIHFTRPGVNGFYPTPNALQHFYRVYFD